MSRWTEDDLNKIQTSIVADKHRCRQEKGKTITASSTVQAIGTLREKGMNKTEKAFANHLEILKKTGEIIWYEFEPINLRLGVNCYYRIDFMVMKADGRLIAYEVKGYWQDDALVKIRTAAEKFPWPFIAVRLVKGHWEYRHF